MWKFTHEQDMEPNRHVTQSIADIDECHQLDIVPT